MLGLYKVTDVSTVLFLREIPTEFAYKDKIIGTICSLSFL